jgi:hypothetical protein
MADCTVETKRTYYLELTEDEARYLKDLTQNKLTPGQESDGGRTRERIFTAINDAYSINRKE